MVHLLDGYQSILRCGTKPWQDHNWVDWFNNRRLLEPIGYITPAEAEDDYDAMMDKFKLAA
jgi:putative transposase